MRPNIQQLNGNKVESTTFPKLDEEERAQSRHLAVKSDYNSRQSERRPPAMNALNQTFSKRVNFMTVKDEVEQK